MSRFLQARWIASAFHLFLYLSMWVLYWLTGAPLLAGPSKYPFSILFVADLPISFPAFSVMLVSEERGASAAVLWGILGTVMWYFLGSAIDVCVRKSRETSLW